MTGNDVLDRVLNLLGYAYSHNIRADADKLLNRAPDIINQICLDLKIPQICRLSDKIAAGDKAIDALYYGTAMLMALVEGDSALSKVFSDIYNGKRSAALSSKDTVEDKLPTLGYGVD